MTPAHKTTDMYRIPMGIFAAVAALAVGCGPAAEGTDAGAAAAATEVDSTAEMSVTAYAVATGPFTHDFSVQGNIETEQNAQITSTFSGAVERIVVKEGQRVTKGTPLMYISTEVLKRSEAELQVQLDLATDMLRRQEKLWQSKIGSEVDLVTARSRKEGLERSMATLREQLAQAVVRAPFSGVVDRIFIKQGELAAPGIPLGRIVNLGGLFVRASVSDQAAPLVKAGTPARIVVAGMDTVVTKVGRVGQFINPANRSVDITLPLPSGTSLLPNMFVSVLVTDFSVASAVTVPASLVQQDVEGADFVWVLEGEGEEAVVRKRTVELGMSSGDRMLVERGLEVGERIVAKGAGRVVEGQTVRILPS
jgi:RND family efflux transporter MFP subunit